MIDGFFRRIAHFVEQHDLIPAHSLVIVACSGGPDSLALLDCLSIWQKKQGFPLMAVHFEHGIRGAASKADAEFVKNFCRARGISCRIGQGDVPAYAAKAKLSLETAARELRYKFFRQAAEEIFLEESQRNPSAIGTILLATGHHTGDQAETVLLRILHGTGLQGLSAMRPKRRLVEWEKKGKDFSVNGGSLPSCYQIRPFLAVTRQEIEIYIKERGLIPRHDATNDDVTKARRNLIRHELLPLLKEKYNPAIENALCRLAEISASAADYIKIEAKKAQIEVAKKNAAGCLVVKRSAFAAQAVAIQQELLRRWAGELPYDDLETLRRFLLFGQTGKKLDLPRSLARLENDRAYITAKASEAKKIVPPKKISVIIDRPMAEGNIWGEYSFSLITTSVIDGDNKEVANKTNDNFHICFDAEAVTWPLVFRPRQSGDIYLLPQGKGRKKLKDFFIDAKIPREKREIIPILSDAAGNIILIVGYKRSGFAYITPKTKNICHVTISCSL